jgi:hypothetical protein
MEWERNSEWLVILDCSVFGEKVNARLAFQTAVALAEYEAVKDSEGKIVLTDKHLKSVVEMSRDFKNYIDDIHQGNEDIRAERRRER